MGSLSPGSTRSTRSPGSMTKSPRTTNYVVRNTFIEVQDHDEEFEIEEEMSRSTFQRRRGSSFWRCASEPPIAPRSPRENRNPNEGLDVGNQLASTAVAHVQAPVIAYEFPRGPPGSF